MEQRKRRKGRAKYASRKGLNYRYDSRQQRKQREYLTDGRLEIDNNLVENAVCPTAVGKKNWLFIGEAEAGSAEPSFTPSLSVADAGASIPIPIFGTF